MNHISDSCHLHSNFRLVILVDKTPIMSRDILQVHPDPKTWVEK